MNISDDLYVLAKQHQAQLVREAENERLAQVARSHTNTGTFMFTKHRW